MSINIIRTNQKSSIKPEDFVDGKAYESIENGLIYIGNVYFDDRTTITGFSLCGNFVVTKGDKKLFREVDLTITVEN